MLLGAFNQEIAFSLVVKNSPMVRFQLYSMVRMDGEVRVRYSISGVHSTGQPSTSSLPCCGCRHYHSLPSHRVNWPQEMLCHLMLGHSYKRGMASADCQRSLTAWCSTAVSLQHKLQGLVITVEGALIHTFCRHQSKYTLQPSTT